MRALTWWATCLILAFFWTHLALFLINDIDRNAYDIRTTCTDDGDCFDERVPITDDHQTFEIDGVVFEFTNVYHEDLNPFYVERVNNNTKVMYIKFDSAFTRGDDGSCQAFGALVFNMLSVLPGGWAIYVTNDWVPSKKNPIDLAWAEELAEGY